MSTNAALGKDRRLSYEEYKGFESKIISAMRNQSCFTVDNLRQMQIPIIFGDTYILWEDSDRYKLNGHLRKNIELENLTRL